jgi:hypothetical protein
VAIAALTERRPVPAGKLPRPLAWSFVPRALFSAGWESGVACALTLIGVLALARLETARPVVLGLAAVLLMPLPVAWALARRLRPVSFTAYLLLQVAFALPAVLYAIGETTTTAWMSSVGGVLVGGFPLSFILISGPVNSHAWTPATLVAYHAVSVAVLLVAVLGALASVRRSATT